MAKKISTVMSVHLSDEYIHSQISKAIRDVLCVSKFVESVGLISPDLWTFDVSHVDVKPRNIIFLQNEKTTKIESPNSALPSKSLTEQIFQSKKLDDTKNSNEESSDEELAKEEAYESPDEDMGFALLM
jgi:hypothetical protein